MLGRGAVLGFLFARSSVSAIIDRNGTVVRRECETQVARGVPVSHGGYLPCLLLLARLDLQRSVAESSGWRFQWGGDQGNEVCRLLLVDRCLSQMEVLAVVAGLVYVLDDSQAGS